MEELRAVFDGHPDRVIIPEDNLIDVSYRERLRAFPNHPMFTDFNAVM